MNPMTVEHGLSVCLILSLLNLTHYPVQYLLWISSHSECSNAHTKCFYILENTFENFDKKSYYMYHHNINLVDIPDQYLSAEALKYNHENSSIFYLLCLYLFLVM